MLENLRAAGQWLRRIPRWGVITAATTALVVVALVVSVTLMRASAVQLLDDAEHAHEAGDCGLALEVLEGLGPVRRTVHPVVASSASAEADACRELRRAEHDTREDAARTYASYLEHPHARWDGAAAARGDALLDQAEWELSEVGPQRMKVGFGTLAVVLGEASDPGHAARARELVADFVARVYADPCKAMDDHAWVQNGSWDEPEIAEPVVAMKDARGEMVLSCARDHRRADKPEAAAALYRTYLRDYPRGDLRRAAARELTVAEIEIQSQKVYSALGHGTYCDDPQRSQEALVYRGGGPNRMIVMGLDPEEHDFPRSWHTSDVDKASLVVCVTGPARGAYQETCEYEDDLLEANDSTPGYQPVRFYASRYTVTAYALRTGEQVASFTSDLGEPCPASISVDSFGGDLAFAPEIYRSRPTSGEIRAMFTDLVGTGGS